MDVAKSLGTGNVIFPDDLGELKKPLNKEKFDYVLDPVGGDVTSVLIPQLFYGGSMSMGGMAAGVELKATVLPFILRGINLLGIDSVNVPIEKRPAIWAKKANDWNISETTLVDEILLEEVPGTIEAIKNGEHLGRTIVKC